MKTLDRVGELVHSFVDFLKGFLEPTPAGELYKYAAPRVTFYALPRRVVAAMINDFRPRNFQGGLDWKREEYIAYALARPLPKWAETLSATEQEGMRTLRFRKHEMFANDNYNSLQVAAILWNATLVEVDGKFFKNDEEWRDMDGTWNQYNVPWGLVEYVERIAPWLPKPPDRRERKAA